MAAVDPMTPKEWFDKAAARKPRKGTTTPLERMLAMPYWEGATVVGVVEHAVVERYGNCRDKQCPQQHAGVAIGRGLLDRRHYETVPCHKVEHPAGATAWIRVND